MNSTIFIVTVESTRWLMIEINEGTSITAFYRISRLNLYTSINCSGAVQNQIK